MHKLTKEKYTDFIHFELFCIFQNFYIKHKKIYKNNLRIFSMTFKIKKKRKLNFFPPCEERKLMTYFYKSQIIPNYSDFNFNLLKHLHIESFLYLQH